MSEQIHGSDTEHRSSPFPISKKSSQAAVRYFETIPDYVYRNHEFIQKTKDHDEMLLEGLRYLHEGLDLSFSKEALFWDGCSVAAHMIEHEAEQNGYPIPRLEPDILHDYFGRFRDGRRPLNYLYERVDEIQKADELFIDTALTLVEHLEAKEGVGHAESGASLLGAIALYDIVRYDVDIVDFRDQLSQLDY